MATVTVTLMDIVSGVQWLSDSNPWGSQYKIPWHDPEFSERMLSEHLSQSHDWASRRLERIEEHIQWVHGNVLNGKASKILDLGCGPGLYTERLARLGHDCTGIDFAPAAIRYAGEHAPEDASCRYILGDVRTCEYGGPYDLVMVTFAEINVFPPVECKAILSNACASLTPGGIVLLELHPFDKVRSMGREGRTWSKNRSGLFSSRPHVCLIENRWDESNSVAQTQFLIIDADTAKVSVFASTTQAYRPDEVDSILGSCGYCDIAWDTDWQRHNPGFVMVLARKAL